MKWPLFLEACRPPVVEALLILSPTLEADGRPPASLVLTDSLLGETCGVCSAGQSLGREGLWTGFPLGHECSRWDWEGLTPACITALPGHSCGRPCPQPLPLLSKKGASVGSCLPQCPSTPFESAHMGWQSHLQGLGGGRERAAPLLFRTCAWWGLTTPVRCLFCWALTCLSALPRSAATRVPGA